MLSAMIAKSSEVMMRRLSRQTIERCVNVEPHELRATETLRPYLRNAAEKREVRSGIVRRKTIHLSNTELLQYGTATKRKCYSTELVNEALFSGPIPKVIGCGVIPPRQSNN
ncbi:hypothetical protein KIN20_026136 [Parelaphostrongylus tenuis]|uniref:Uncharacterized protein n=1 Tax=Parelaphostrongylus tenuis TaxID=148309 RepID=A0AAD5MWA1_PARTN|nr:hypothetical protein KIN20_026136 [Parelaphostrongylus tenuis]